MAATRSPQGGIFALGTAAHAYLEFDAPEGKPTTSLVRAIASLREPRTTMGGVNLVAGVRPEAWREALPDDAPADLAGFNEDLAGSDGFVVGQVEIVAVRPARGLLGERGNVRELRDRRRPRSTTPFSGCRAAPTT